MSTVIKKEIKNGVEIVTIEEKKEKSLPITKKKINIEEEQDA